MSDDFVTRREFDMARDYERQLHEKDEMLRAADLRAIQVRQEADDRAKHLEQSTSRDYRMGQNEWRGESADRQATYAPRAEVAAQFATLTAKLDPVISYVESQKGRSAGITALQALLIALATLAIAAMSVVVALHR
jgi:hypothetical protein